MDETIQAQVEAIHAAPDDEAAEMELALIKNSDNGPKETDPEPD